ncbi:MAG: hypothetical protein JST54_23385, partial [Deltaproteobacteria bacterium]|nr:hypothetical protein [Deltaproteobacteria bacterium]
PKVEAPKVEAPKVEAPKPELPKPPPVKVEAPKVEAPKPELPKPPPVNVEPPKVEAQKPEPKAPPRSALDEAHETLASFADRPLSDEELKVIAAIEALADGEIEDTPVKQAKPAHMIAALVRLLIRRGIIQETEFLIELTRK